MRHHAEKRPSDEYLGFAPPKKAVTPEPEPPADDPPAYVDSWYQVLKGVGEDEEEGETES
jgi:hypothetical protein